MEVDYQRLWINQGFERIGKLLSLYHMLVIAQYWINPPIEQ
jgi:hypothetical protein